MSTVTFWSVFGYIRGAVPFADILGKRFTRQDIHTVGDGNPGSVWPGLPGLWGFTIFTATAGLPAILVENAWAAVFRVSLILVWAIVLDVSPGMTRPFERRG